MKKTTMLLLLLLPLIFLTGMNINAQDNKESVIISMVDKLQQKVLLTEDQKNQIVNIIRNDNSEGLGDAQSRVDALLDQRQKAKYNIIKADWWSTLNRELKAKQKRQIIYLCKKGKGNFSFFFTWTVRMERIQE